MPIERQSEQFGIFEDMPMPDRTAMEATPSTEDLSDLLGGPGITAGLMGRDPLPLHTAAEMTPGTESDATGMGWKDMQPKQEDWETGVFIPSVGTAAWNMADNLVNQINLDPSLRGSGNDTTAWNPGPKVGKQATSQMAPWLQEGYSDEDEDDSIDPLPLPPSPTITPEAMQTALRVLRDRATYRAGALPGGPAAAQPPAQAQQPELPMHLWDADSQQPACGVDQPINVTSNDFQVTCPECQVALERKKQEAMADEQEALMAAPQQPVMASVKRYSGPACDCGCPINSHVAASGLKPCSCGGCERLTVRV